MNEKHWAIDCHDTLQDVWRILEFLKERLASNKKCSERFVLEINNIQTAVSKLDWDDELVMVIDHMSEKG